MWAILNRTNNKIVDKFYDKHAAEITLATMPSDYKIVQCPSDREIFENGKIVMEDVFKDPFWSGGHDAKVQIKIVDYEGKLFYFRIEEGYIAKVIEIGDKGVY